MNAQFWVVTEHALGVCDLTHSSANEQLNEEDRDERDGERRRQRDRERRPSQHCYSKAAKLFAKARFLLCSLSKPSLVAVRQ